MKYVKLVSLVTALFSANIYAADISWPHLNSLEPVVEVAVDDFCAGFDMPAIVKVPDDYPFAGGTRFGTYADVLLLQMVLKETSGGHTFYRLFYYEDGRQQADNPFQEIYYELNGRLIYWMGAVYEKTWVAQTMGMPAPEDEGEYTAEPDTYYSARNNFMIINTGKKIGLLFTQIKETYQKEFGTNAKIDKNFENTAQLIWADANGSLEFSDTANGKGAVEITSSTPLIDAGNPFRYTIQNAFDGNPATSFVENTDDDLLKVVFKFNGTPLRVSSVKIINGFAKDSYLYNANNKIKTVLFGFRTAGYSKTEEAAISEKPSIIQELSDNYPNYQSIETYDVTVYGCAVVVQDVYPGTQWKDTCLAELVLYEGNGVLVGNRLLE